MEVFPSAHAIGDFACLVFAFGGICETASCPVRDLSSPRVDQSARCPVRELAIRELAYPRVVQLPLQVSRVMGINTDPNVQTLRVQKLTYSQA